MIIFKHINKDNWSEIKDILPDITEIESLDLSYMELTEFPKMSHITINGSFYCNNNKLTSFTNCPIINDDFVCYNNQITSFKDCPAVGGYLFSGVGIFNIVQEYSKRNKVSLLKAQVELYNQQNKELYNQQNKELLKHIDRFPDLVAYIRLKKLNKLL